MIKVISSCSVRIYIYIFIHIYLKFGGRRVSVRLRRRVVTRKREMAGVEEVAVDLHSLYI